MNAKRRKSIGSGSETSPSTGPSTIASTGPGKGPASLQPRAAMGLVRLSFMLALTLLMAAASALAQAPEAGSVLGPDPALDPAPEPASESDSVPESAPSSAPASGEGAGAASLESAAAEPEAVAGPLQIDRLSADLEARLDQAEADEVLAFIDRYAGTAPAERLRRQWLQRLAREQRWSELLGVYVDDGSAQRACWYRRALLATGRAEEAFAGLSSLYLTGRSLPGSCDPLFAAWAAAGGLESALVWERVERALARNNAGVAVFQGRYLPESQRPWLDLLVAVHRRPTLLLEQPITAEQVSDSVRRQRILVHGLERLAADSADQAELVWASIAAAEDLPPALAERADAAVGPATRGPSTIWLGSSPAPTMPICSRRACAWHWVCAPGSSSPTGRAA